MSAVLRIARSIRTRTLTAIAAAGLIATVACTSSEPADRPSNPATDSYASSLGINVSQFTKLTDDILYRDLIVGSGAEATSGKTVRMTYTGWLPNGRQFESNEGQPPYPVTLGIGEVVQGWDQGIVGMRAGGKRRLLIGSGAGYGRSGRGDIPPNTTMIFDVMLQSVQ